MIIIARCVIIKITRVKIDFATFRLIAFNLAVWCRSHDESHVCTLNLFVKYNDSVSEKVRSIMIIDDEEVALK